MEDRKHSFSPVNIETAKEFHDLPYRLEAAGPLMMSLKQKYFHGAKSLLKRSAHSPPFIEEDNSTLFAIQAAYDMKLIEAEETLQMLDTNNEFNIRDGRGISFIPQLLDRGEFPFIKKGNKVFRIIKEEDAICDQDNAQESI